MKTLCLTLCRFALVAWVGAAAIFVVTAVQEATSTDFDSLTKAKLAVLRFPTYYAFGFALVGTALVSGVIGCRHPTIGKLRTKLFLGLLVLALVTMVVDYVVIYRPLEEMLLAETSARPASFQTYHDASKYINAADVALCLLAALLICIPGGRSSSEGVRG